MHKKKCNICKENTFIDKHHIQSLSENGSNKKWNIVEVCPNCHRKIHTGEIIIEGWFNSTGGKTLIWRNKNDEKIIKDRKDKKVYIINKKG